MSVRRVRRLDLPWLALIILSVWGTLVAVAHMARLRGVETPLVCHLRRTTGVPCPTCGGTRAGFSLIHLDPIGALAHNPLVTLALVASGLYVIARTATGRGLVIEWTKRSRRGAWAAFALALLANWAWVIAQHR